MNELNVIVNVRLCMCFTGILYSAVLDIGRARFEGHTTPGGRTRMMITGIR